MILSIIILLIIDLYAFQALKTVFADSPTLKSTITIGYWLINISIYLAALVGLRSGFGAPTLMVRIILGALICISIAKAAVVLFLLTDDVIRLFKWLSNQFYRQADTAYKYPDISRSQFISKLGLLAGGTMLGAFVYGMARTAYNYKIRTANVALPQLPPTFKGLKIVQISDLHLGSFINTSSVDRAVEIINQQEADLIFFTGDMVNRHYNEAEPFIPILSKLKANHGVFSVLGNHDYYGTPADLEKMKTIHDECGWTILNNANKILEIDGQSIAIVGVENWGQLDYFPKIGNLNIACKGCEAVDAKLLLSHDPSHWDYVVSEKHKDIDITFSGHTHGFQMGVEIPFLKIKWSPSQYAYKQWAGLYNKGNQYLYVNRGLGFIGWHGRVGIPPEITVMNVTGKA